MTRTSLDALFPAVVAEGHKPWLSKKSAFLKESVPVHEYQPNPGALLRDDLGGMNQRKGIGTEYIQELKRTHDRHKHHTSLIEQRTAQAPTGVKEQQARQDTKLLD